MWSLCSLPGTNHSSLVFQVSSEEDIPTQQEPSYAALVEVLQAAAEPLVTEKVASGLQFEGTVRIEISNPFHRRLIDFNTDITG